MRREWIEISSNPFGYRSRNVSLHAEGVDLNEKCDIEFEEINGLPPCGGSGLKYGNLYNRVRKLKSPSMRREWIEIQTT